MWAGLLEGEHGRCCDFRFVFVLFLNLGGCGLMGVGRFFFFFLSCFLNCFKLQMFKRITSHPHPHPHPHRNHCNEIRQWGDWAADPKAIGCSFSKSKRSRLQGWGDLAPVSQALVGAWALGLGKGDGADFVSVC